MKFRRMLSILLVVLTVVTCAAVAGTAVASGASADLAATSAYQDMLAKTAADDYGLAKTVNEGTILQAWNWSFKNIEANLELLAQQGFTTLQVSPPNEIKEGTKGINVLQRDGKNGWWMYYQPAGFQLNNSTDNALGTKDEFISMCEKAHSYGIKIIVDAVINHMGTCDNEEKVTSTDPMAHLTPRAALFEPEIVNNQLFHKPWKNMQYLEDPSRYTQYESTYDLTRNCTSRLPDLMTEDSRVQTAIYDYMDELITAGADGFRFDAAKHIETPDDIASLRSDFWTNTLGKVRKNHPESEVYAYGEILNNCGVNRPFSMYTKLFDVTDSGSYWSIKDAATNGGGNATPYYPNSNFTAANTILWNESHDTYMDGATTSLTTVQRGKIWALVAGRAVITTVYFARPDDSTSTNACYNIALGDLKKTAWSNATTKAVNQFHNYFVKDSEYCTANQSGWSYIERGNSGAVIVRLGNSTSGSCSLTNHVLKPGTYIDSLTGNTFTVTSNRITGNVGSTGVACIYYDNSDIPTIPTSSYPTYGEDDPDVVPTRDGYYTVVFSNSLRWDGAINYYYWPNGGDGPIAWPGEPASFYDQNEFGENRYIAFIPMDCPNVIFNNGTLQTSDYALSNHTGLYAGDLVGENTYQAMDYPINTTPPETQPQTQTETPPETQPTTELVTQPSTEPSTAAPVSSEPSTQSTAITYRVGDADRSGSVDILDVTMIQQHLAEIAMITDPVAMKAADADEDGNLSILDATRIQRFLALLDQDKGYNTGKEKEYQ